MRTEPRPVTSRSAAQHNRWRPGRRTVGLLAALLLLLTVSTTAYLAIGWHRMDATCTRDDVAPPGSSGVSFGWSWTPPGFQCTWDTPNGHIERTSLWW